MSTVGSQKLAGYAAKHYVGINASTGWTSHQPQRSFPPIAKCKSSNAYNRKHDPLYIPRPANSFMLFRGNFVATLPEGFTAPENKSLSKLAGEAWKQLPASEKKKWAKKAHEVSAEHAKRNPTWKYRPARRSDKQKREEQTPPPHDAGVVTFHPNPAISNVLPDNSFPPNLIQRKESLRLSNWDDSVLFPAPYAASYSFEGQQLYQLPDSLRRRSSSVPVPDGNSNPSMTLDSSHFHSSGPPTSSTLGHRLSYSGIRPGFIPVDIFSSAPQHGTPIREDDTPNMFEGYNITYVQAPSHAPVHPQPTWPGEALYASPIPQAPLDYRPATEMQRWEHPYGLDVRPGVSNNVSTPTSLSDSRVHYDPSPPMHSLQRSSDSSFTSPENQLYQAQGNHRIPEATESDTLVGRMRFIDFGMSRPESHNSDPQAGPSPYRANLKPLTRSDEFFQNDNMPLSEFFPQYVQHFGELQLSGLDDINGADAIVMSQYKERQGVSSSDPRFAGFRGEFDMVDNFVHIPSSATTSSCSSAGSPSYLEQLELDSEILPVHF